MDEIARYVVSIDPASRVVKVEQIGEAGDLTEVDASSFVQALGAGPAGASSAPQVVINIYGGGPPGGTARVALSKELPYTVMGWDCPPLPPPNKPEDPGKK